MRRSSACPPPYTLECNTLPDSAPTRDTPRPNEPRVRSAGIAEARG